MTSDIDIRSNELLDKVIFEKGLRIKSIRLLRPMRTPIMLITLSNKTKLRVDLTKYFLDTQDIQNYEIIGGGIGISWPNHNVDISLKGILVDVLQGGLKTTRTSDNNFALSA